MIRTLLLALACLSVTAFAAAQTTRGVISSHAAQNAIRAPVTATATIACGATSYRVSILDGSCSTFSNPDADGNPTPPDYAHCTNARGDHVAASCRYGCAPAAGSGQCLTIRDHR